MIAEGIDKRINYLLELLSPVAGLRDVRFTIAEIQNSEIRSLNKKNSGRWGLTDMTLIEVIELTDSEGEILGNEDLAEMIKSATDEVDEPQESHVIEVEDAVLTVERLARICKNSKELQAMW